MQVTLRHIDGGEEKDKSEEEAGEEEGTQTHGDENKKDKIKSQFSTVKTLYRRSLNHPTT